MVHDEQFEDLENLLMYKQTAEILMKCKHIFVNKFSTTYLIVFEVVGENREYLLLDLILCHLL